MMSEKLQQLHEQLALQVAKALSIIALCFHMLVHFQRAEIRHAGGLCLKVIVVFEHMALANV